MKTDAVNPARTTSSIDRFFRATLPILGLLALIGLPVLFYRMQAGLKVTHLGSVVPWGVWVAFYIYFIGLSAGSFLLSTLVYVFRVKTLEPVGRIAVLQAFVCLLTGLAFIFIDLGHWERFWYTMVYPQWNSVLAWEIWFYNAYVVVLLFELWLLLRFDLARWAYHATGWRRTLYRVLSLGLDCKDTPEEAERYHAYAVKWLSIIGIIGIPVALGVHGGTGAIFAVVKARPAWYSPIFPLVFIVSALASGGGLLLFLRAFLAPDPKEDKTILPLLARITGGFLVFDLMLLGLEFLVGLYGGMPDHVEVYHLITSGPFWYIFWFLQLGIGAVASLWMLFYRTDQASPFRLGLAGWFIVLGIFGVRLNIVIPALAVPVFRGYDHIVDSPRLASLYIPNWVEWLSSLGIVSAVTLLAYLAIRMLPMKRRQPYPFEPSQT